MASDADNFILNHLYSACRTDRPTPWLLLQNSNTIKRLWNPGKTVREVCWTSSNTVEVQKASECEYESKIGDKWSSSFSFNGKFKCFDLHISRLLAKAWVGSCKPSVAPLSVGHLCVSFRRYQWTLITFVITGGLLQRVYRKAWFWSKVVTQSRRQKKNHRAESSTSKAETFS